MFSYWLVGVGIGLAIDVVAIVGCWFCDGLAIGVGV